MILILAGILLSTLLTLFFSTLVYALRDYSRAKLEDYLAKYGRSELLEKTVDCSRELIFITAVCRLVANVFIVAFSLRLFEYITFRISSRYLGAIIVSTLLTFIFSTAIPTALARYVGEPMIAIFARALHTLRYILFPLVNLMHLTERLILRMVGNKSEPEPEQIEKDILSVVEDGEKEGVVDTTERKMIESVIEFRDARAGQVMTTRPEVVGIELGATLEEVKHTLDQSGHSRLPVYDGTLDHIVGILYARDLLKHLGLPPEQFDMRSAMRPAIFVPETKPLRDLLREFRIQRVHIAIVLDEYGGTAGLVTIEDILEELVGEISDEHPPHSTTMMKKVSDNAYEVDAALDIDQINRTIGLNLPEDAGYETLGGFVSVMLGRIPQKGTTFEHNGVRYTILDAEPQRVKRLKIELLPQPAEAAGKNV
ncbi:MAG TPA: hemolysin family protein [Tepidisphaeraceae bacterium]|jgi:putative hemolysin|nr:hemolysin family protein [Tepidisphaeraceae bacterium]HEV8603936.1 hemolysin family protein [Tepidisphaeraceae bacterium]